MAAPSPALSSNSSDTATATTTAAVASTAVTATATATAANTAALPAAKTTTAAVSATATASAPAPAAAAASSVPAANTVVHRTDTPPKTLRGLNKPKCKQCGNVARSRCPYESCKSCCAKAQNPCYIHVLKANATFPDKTPPSNSTLFDQHSTEASPSGNSHRVASLRQLSNTFAQFNNVQIPLRSRKPMTRKDAAAINEWRFSKLKEYKDRNIEVEDEAFDRYMQNVNLLEELFSVKSIPERSMEDVNSIPERSMEDGTSNHDPTSMDDETGPTVSGLTLMLRSDPVRTDNFRERMKQIVDQGLNKLQKCELDYALNEPINQNELDKGPKRTKDLWAEGASALSDLNDRLNKARNDEDLKYCLELKSQLFSHHTSSSHVGSNSEILKDQNANNNLESTKVSNYSLSRLVTSVEIDQETLRNVDAHFSSLQQIEGL